MKKLIEHICLWWKWRKFFRLRDKLMKASTPGPWVIQVEPEDYTDWEEPPPE